MARKTSTSPKGPRKAKSTRNAKTQDAKTKARALAADGWALLRTAGWVVGQMAGIASRPARRALKKPKTWTVTGLHASSLAFAGLLAFGFTLVWQMHLFTPADDVDLWAVNRPPSVTFLNRDGDVIGTRGSYYGDPIAMEALPDHVVAAFVSTEDRRFFEHHGFDPKGFARAVLTNIREGQLAEGASTISQQLARNLFLTQDRTLTRKLQELNLAFWLEARLTKEEILSLYLNRTYLGAGTYGIEAASQLYFSKPAVELTVSEAALIAGLPKAPSALAPTTNFAGANTRSQEVIDNMVETGRLSPAEAEAAKAAPPELIIASANVDHGYFFDYVMVEAKELLEEIDTDIVVETTINSALQEKAQDALKAAMTDDVKALGARQAAMIAYDNQSGAIITMVGGTSYEESQFNRATQALRQPGSTFKPFVYLAALEAGMTPRTMFIDQPIIVDGWQPTNYSGSFDGPMRMTEALARSVNTVAVQTTETIGRERVINTARQMGIHHSLQPVPSIALGAASVTLDELTAAYLPFARNGLSATPYAITRIENRKGEILYEYERGAEEQVIPPQTSEEMNYLLHQVMVNGTGSRANLGNRQAAGKTGTTNDWRDAWFVGYTGQITTGVWVGNDDNEPMQKVTGGSVPASIWKSFMLAAHADLPRIALPGANRLQYDTNSLRLAQFYGNLTADLSAAAQGGPRQTNGYDGFPPQPAGRQDTVVGRAYNDDSPPPQNDPPREKKRRGWWIFGSN